MTYDERDSCAGHVVLDRLEILFEQNGLDRHSAGLENIPVAPEIP